MKVNNTAIFLGDNTRRERNRITEKEAGSAQNIFAGNLNKQLDPIAQKKRQAKEKAMKIVGDAWAGERKIDEDIESRREKIRECKETIGKANSELKEIAKRREELRESYGVAADSQEEQDLKLLEKEINSKKPGSGINLTKEEREQLAEIKKQGLTEYQQRSLELKSNGAVYEKEITEANEQILAENAVIKGIKLERLKSQTMLKAEKSADKIMENAGEQIVGMLVDEAKNHIDEEMAEAKEAAEKKAEEKEIQEERIEKQKDDREEKEEFIEEVAESSELIVEADNVLSEVQKEIKKIMDEMKLVEEDIKGAAVDATIS